MFDSSKSVIKISPRVAACGLPINIQSETFVPHAVQTFRYPGNLSSILIQNTLPFCPIDPIQRTLSFTANKTTATGPPPLSRRPQHMPNLDQKQSPLLAVRFCKAMRSKKGCLSPHCPNLHLCPFHLLGQCDRDQAHCCRSHDPHDQHTRRVLRDLGLADVTPEMLSFLKKLASDTEWEWKTPHSTVPGICSFYKKGDCLKGSMCAYLHVCAYWVGGGCRYGGNCKKDHNFLSDHNQRVLKRDELHDLPELDMVKLLRECSQ